MSKKNKKKTPSKAKKAAAVAVAAAEAAAKTGAAAAARAAGAGGAGGSRTPSEVEPEILFSPITAVAQASEDGDNEDDGGGDDGDGVESRGEREYVDARIAGMEGRLMAALTARQNEAKQERPRPDFSDVSDSDGEHTRPVLPVRRVVEQGRDKRLRGGVDRLPLRMSALRRVHGRELTEPEIGRLGRTLEVGSKVPPVTNTHARAHAHAGRRAQGTATLSESMLVEMGDIAPRGEAERTLAAMTSAFREKAAKDVKTVKHYGSFALWYKKYSDEGFFSQDLLDRDEDTYWCWDWHLKCMLFVMAEYDWATAVAYHKRVVLRWHRLPLEDLAYSLDCREGAWEDALHSRSLFAVQLKNRSKWTSRDGSDYWCRPCGKHFPKANNHPDVCPKKAGAGGGRPRA